MEEIDINIKKYINENNLYEQDEIGEFSEKYYCEKINELIKKY